MLEGDYDVDWEVDPNEHSHANHPHRVPLRGRAGRRPRRPGTAAARPQVCLSPIGSTASPERQAAGGGARAGAPARRAHDGSTCVGSGRACRHGG
jgi:hypothetical protein